MGLWVGGVPRKTAGPTLRGVAGRRTLQEGPNVCCGSAVAKIRFGQNWWPKIGQMMAKTGPKSVPSHHHNAMERYFMLVRSLLALWNFVEVARLGTQEQRWCS